MLDLLASRDHLRSTIANRRRRTLRPPPQLTADEWADTYRIVPSETSAVTGRWDTSMYEVARGPMRAITEPGVRIITGVASAQIFKTSTCETAVGYFMHMAPCPILVYEPTDTTVSAFVDSKLDPMIRSTPELAALWGGRKALERKRDDFTAQKKTFAGGYIEILTANSPANTASRSAKIVVMDEVDKFESTRDGDPVALIDERTKGFSGEELSIRMSTPTIEGESPIAAEYAKSDRRKPYLECPHCGEWHYLKWSQVHYKNAEGKADPEAACYVCESCGCAWTEAERIKPLTTLGAISWRQTKPFKCCDERQDPEVERRWNDEGRALCKTCGRRAVSNRHAGFWAWEAYHPRRSLADLVRSWLDCHGNRGKLQNFVNSKLAECWRPQEEEAGAVDADQFAARVEPTWDAVPAAVRVLTMGVDVQPRGPQSPGRLEAEVVGWGDGEETWSIEYHVIEGDPDEPDVWAQLDEIRLRAYQRDDGKPMHVQAVCVDTGGHNLDSVMAYCGARRNARVWAIKGASELGGKRQPIWPVSPPKTVKHGARLYIVGTLSGKDWVASCISKTASGPMFMHVPADRSSSWFEQLLNEKRVSFQQNGRTMTTWKPRASGARTEALDCRVYAKAALEGLRRLGVRLGVASAAATATPAPAAPTDGQAAPAPAPVPPTAPRRKLLTRKPAASSFWS
ncbi:terminase gpA endonuclease subunit [Cereibacter johrii]|uniref:phage terminase large subunit family protein n=1 Tax=Cereibacter johrii TaxID=445629 RepID=UPI002B25BD65|nr:terminase gpA endonuclease subunit [Cereibacter johrii]MEA5159986.1 terminase gpA endonuclease subunit [Cereibacter johrii]